MLTQACIDEVMKLVQLQIWIICEHLTPSKPILALNMSTLDCFAVYITVLPLLISAPTQAAMTG